MVVDFYTRQEITTLGDKIVKVPRTRAEYLETCKKTLESEDYIDLLCSILDPEIFCEVEDHIVKLVEAYYSFKN